MYRISFIKIVKVYTNENWRVVVFRFHKHFPFLSGPFVRSLFYRGLFAICEFNGARADV